MLLNTDTTPNIDGIHKVTRLGSGSNAGRIFYIDEFIKAVSYTHLRAHET